MVEELNKKGAPYGNQNARKHGFYSSVLTDAEQVDFIQATGVDGLDEEIALFRVKIKSLVQHDSENVKLIIRAVNSLERLVRTKYSIGKDDKKGIMDSIANILKDVALPVGMIGATLKK